jgi:hypothetical protein
MSAVHRLYEITKHPKFLTVSSNSYPQLYGCLPEVGKTKLHPNCGRLYEFCQSTQDATKANKNITRIRSIRKSYAKDS